MSDAMKTAREAEMRALAAWAAMPQPRDNNPVWWLSELSDHGLTLTVWQLSLVHHMYEAGYAHGVAEAMRAIKELERS